MEIITIYDYEWAADDDYSVWAPFEASVLTIDAATFNGECRGSVQEAVEGGHAEPSGEYEVAKPLEVPQDVLVYGDANKVTKHMCEAILGCDITLEQWADERGIEVAEATTMLSNVKPAPTTPAAQTQLGLT